MLGRPTWWSPEWAVAIVATVSWMALGYAVGWLAGVALAGEDKPLKP